MVSLAPDVSAGNGAGARGLIAVDKMGCKVLFLDPVINETQVTIDGFPRKNSKSQAPAFLREAGTRHSNQAALAVDDLPFIACK